MSIKGWLLRQITKNQDACREQEGDQSLLTLWWPVMATILIQIKQ